MKFFLSVFILFFVTACTSTGELAGPEPSRKNIEELQQEMFSRSAEWRTAPFMDEKSLPESYDNLWLKLAEGFEFEVPQNARVAKQRDYFLKHPNHLAEVSKRAEPFLYLIIEQIEAKNLPLELALLPVVESTFNPFAYSQSHASGLWQFMPATGVRFGLTQDWWYDGRRDVYASTDAALTYMDILHNYLNEDWLHALAAYNSGEGRVERAVRANKKYNKPTDYWHLSLPIETQEYVPKLLALVDILRNHKKYGIELPVIANKQVLTYVDTGSQLDLAYAAELAELSPDDLQLLNPAYNRWVTSPNGPHRLLIPTKIAQQFSQKLANTAQNKRTRWSRYTVQSGDNLGFIARENYTTINILKQVNNLDSAFIKIGQPLLIPFASEAQKDDFSRQARRFEGQQASANKTKKKVIYTVSEADTLWDISRDFNVRVKEIAKWNTINSTEPLQLGQKLTVWKAIKSTPNKNDTHRMTYQVRAGDSLHLIASKFNVKLVDLVRWNELNKGEYIQPGQKLELYVAVQKSRT
ncbi:Lytic transglycosylase, catalytic [Psychromonas ingrahamii 37]|uniref:Lytic transglycosylase, catalytic n=1 Tax=Psychromonas ingrahamii (strain DSM 17664 / CCUG 51855 / 37) TaxID=357804 RepID=A1SS89_PSYIN|nr:LysM peptidoglycan-binding domain-containing protein [Psychromonas ingrahamii]ABM02354.1 Lytic transglycosylase, catalytic [Psychromonas ingrahamii 37]